MKFKRIDHIGIIVNDLAAAKAFFVDFGLKVTWEAPMEDARLDRIIGLTGAKSEVAMVELPDGKTTLELIKFVAPATASSPGFVPANTYGIRHIAFQVDDIEAIVAHAKAQGHALVGEIENFDPYLLAYIRGPEGIILELAQELK
jgi:catechol 2,3-dioxygenase-like lactoylglutathione lyase family enzyme